MLHCLLALVVILAPALLVIYLYTMLLLLLMLRENVWTWVPSKPFNYIFSANQPVEFEFNIENWLWTLKYFQEFTGNNDRDGIVERVLDPPLIARYVRVNPKAWYGHNVLRLELYGCRSGKVKEVLLYCESASVRWSSYQCCLSTWHVFAVLWSKGLAYTFFKL